MLSTPWGALQESPPLTLTVIPCYVHSSEEEAGGPSWGEACLRSPGQGGQSWKSHNSLVLAHSQLTEGRPLPLGSVITLDRLPEAPDPACFVQTLA